MFVSSPSPRSAALRGFFSMPFLTRDASWMRFMARAALGGWLLPLLFALFATFTATPAQAQAPVQTVVVLDFAVSPGLDPLLGRKAADGLAVELQRSGDYEVVTRQRVEEAVGQQAGLQPPFNDTAQIRLAQAVGARSVFSGRVVAVELTPGRAARVRLEARQLDSSTGDFVNGTQVVESTEQKLQDVANEILVDEAINKSVFSAVRSMRQTNLPEGSVLNTTREDVELSIGSRNGVGVGQRYSVLRDVFNKAKQITERVKIGELTISRVESDQSVGVLSAGGTAGVRTGDRIRQIFVARSYPTTSTGTNGGSVTPVTAPPVRSSNEPGGIGGIARRGGKGAAGLLALAGLIGLVGLGGGGSSSSAPSVRIATAAESGAVSIGDGDFAYPASLNSEPRPAVISFTSGFRGFSIATTLQSESVVGYLIYRGTSPSFSADITNLQGFIDGRNSSSASQRITFSDPPTSTPTRRRVIITASDSGDGDGNNGGGGQSGRITISDSLFTAGADDFTESEGEITFDFTQRPLVIGQTYYYRVGRVTAERVRETTNNNNGGNNGGNDGNDDEDINVRLLPSQSRISAPTGGFTALLQPQAINNVNNFDTDNFSVRVNFDPSFFGTSAAFALPGNVNVGTGANQFRVQVSTSTSFSETTTFTSPDLPPPTTSAGGDIIFDLGDIRIPDSNNAYVPGQTPLFVRVLSRNTEDAVPIFRVSRTISIGTALGINSAGSSRFLASPAATRGGGVNILRGRGGRGAAGGGSTPPRVLRPR
jgi:hypothetical protein